MADRESFLEYWKSVRVRTLRVAACIPPDKLEWRERPDRWSAGDILRHVGAVEHQMYAETARGRPSAYRGHDRTLADGLEAILVFMAHCHEESLGIFRQLSDEQWVGRTRTPAGIELTTWKWLRAMVEHEAHHRGQLYSLLASLGVATPPLYGLTEPELASRGQPAEER